MHISILGLILLIVLLTWSAQQIDEAIKGLFWLALGLAGLIVSGVLLFFCGKFLLAHPALLVALVCGGLAWAVVYSKHEALRASQRTADVARMERASLEGVAGEIRDNRIKEWLAYKPYDGPGHLFPKITDEQRWCADEWNKRPYLLTAAPTPVYRDADFEAWQKARNK